MRGGGEKGAQNCKHHEHELCYKLISTAMLFSHVAPTYQMKHAKDATGHTKLSNPYYQCDLYLRDVSKPILNPGQDACAEVPAKVSGQHSHPSHVPRQNLPANPKLMIISWMFSEPVTSIAIGHLMWFNMKIHFMHITLTENSFPSSNQHEKLIHLRGIWYVRIILDIHSTCIQF